ncbi:GNAT family N-acetyltransferase [Photobacterium sp. SDRW27]|uniref:GNAT family N-acetyltransferase n=1 Tax=Photobacterium obscurum TaxID=2829490 RepID=UPI0022440ED0|nr:GNAT family N-acetyltransferase [Photobacterium obscurum]MCW8328589.1 GNAT family N-acetyltransferase [Photobacterium obscurum]
MNIYPLRAFISDDIDAVADIYHRAATTLGKDFYSPEQITTWADYPRSYPDEFETLVNQSHTLVAVNNNNQPIAFGQLHPSNHLTLLYVLPEYSRQGLGKKIYLTLEAIAIANSQSTISVTASKVSKSLFEQLGFELIEEEVSVRNNIPFERYNMVKVLQPQK